MEIGKKLKSARNNAGLSQEQVAENIQVSRQTISNWENEKSFPDILSVIQLSNLYQVSLDDFLKGDEKMMKHLEESTNVIKSNQKLLMAIGLNILLVIVFALFQGMIGRNVYLIIACFSALLISTGILFYQIIRKF